MSPAKIPSFIMLVMQIILFCNSKRFSNYHIESITKIKTETTASSFKTSYSEMSIFNLNNSPLVFGLI